MLQSVSPGRTVHVVIDAVRDAGGGLTSPKCCATKVPARESVHAESREASTSATAATTLRRR